jgi:hypothetical protein
MIFKKNSMTLIEELIVLRNAWCALYKNII